MPQCEEAFGKCQSVLSISAVLVHYDDRRPLKLVCDASSYGLGAVLSHVFIDEECPIAFASRSLNI